MKYFLLKISLGQLIFYVILFFGALFLYLYLREMWDQWVNKDKYAAEERYRARKAEARKREREKMKAAKSEYENALEALKNDSSKENKIRLLEAGRRYADIARKQAGSGGVALFDEVALQNDLTAYGAD